MIALVVSALALAAPHPATAANLNALESAINDSCLISRLSPPARAPETQSSHSVFGLKTAQQTLVARRRRRRRQSAVVSISLAHAVTGKVPLRRGDGNLLSTQYLAYCGRSPPGL